MVDDHLGVGMLLVDTAAAPGEAFRTDIWVVVGVDAADFPATAWVALDEVDEDSIRGVDEERKVA